MVLNLTRKEDLSPRMAKLIARCAAAFVQAVGSDDVSVDEMTILQALLLGETITQAEAGERAQLRSLAGAHIDMVIGAAS